MTYTTSLFYNFDPSDVGVYQCFLTNNEINEVFIPTPIRMDTGKLLLHVGVVVIWSLESLQFMA